MSDWKPIETAPKDGTRIWAYDWARAQQKVVWWVDDLRYGAYWMDYVDSEPTPTHWMPLPSPPETPHD